MTFPSTSFQVVLYLALLVPGVVFAASRVQLRGPRAADRSVAARVLEAVVASAIFDSIYAILFHEQVAVAVLDVRVFVATNVIGVAIAFLACGVAVPYVVAWAVYGQVPILEKPLTSWERLIRPKLTRSQEANDTPTAWDYGNKTVGEGWVRIRIDSGVWVGGLFDEGSRFSTYPEPRDIFIAQQWKLGPTGEFQSAVAGSQGVWLAVKDEYVVEWLQDQEDTDGKHITVE
ncbi:MAG TPA: DUF6338 family protein [Pseudolysinimonas sp.]|nr:DUF6338 family protein [Pseudolysinimonas sp.]